MQEEMLQEPEVSTRHCLTEQTKDSTRHSWMEQIKDSTRHSWMEPTKDSTRHSWMEQTKDSTRHNKPNKELPHKEGELKRTPWFQTVILPVFM